MKFLITAATSLLLTVCMAAQQPQTPSSSTPGTSAQPAQNTTPGASSAQPGANTQPQAQAPAQTVPSSQPAQGATGSTSQPATTTGAAPTAPAAASQHPGYPNGPGMIEGCIVQSGNGYAIKPSSGGPTFTLMANQDLKNLVGKQAKVYGYPATPAAEAARVGIEPSTPPKQDVISQSQVSGPVPSTPGETGQPQSTGGTAGAATSTQSGQSQAPQSGAIASSTSATAAQAGAARESSSNTTSANEHTLQTTEVIGLGQSCTASGTTPTAGAATSAPAGGTPTTSGPAPASRTPR